MRSATATDRADRLVRESLERRWSGRFAPAGHIDWLLLLAALLLTAVGFVMIGGATIGPRQAAGLEPGHYVQRQMLTFSIGLVSAIGIVLIDYRAFRAWSIIIYALALLLLMGVFVLGTEVNGSERWFVIGPLQFQPSEFAKVAIILVLAAHFQEYREEALGLRALVEALAIASLPMLMILAQPDLGTFIVFVAILFGILLLAGVHLRYLVALVIGGVVASAAALQLGIVKDYQVQRLTAFLDPEGTDALGAGYNVAQAKIAVGSGQIFGQGLGGGSQTTSGFVPESQTDFIFTVVGEQTGFVGSVLVLLLFAVLLWRATRIAATSRDMFGTLIAAGAISVFALQMFINVGMAIGIMPVTGLPLPFVSYGGTSLVTSWVLIGLLQNVHMRRHST
jgi:rod shape determining protein RodA